MSTKPSTAKPVAPSGTWATTWPRWQVGVTGAALFVLGALVALSAAFLHRGLWPVGLIFGLACTAALGVAGGTYVRTRAGAIIPAIGWTLMVIFLTTPRSEGDLVIGGGPEGYAFMLGGLVTQVLVVLAVPYGRGQ